MNETQAYRAIRATGAFLVILIAGALYIGREWWVLMMWSLVEWWLTW